MTHRSLGEFLAKYRSLSADISDIISTDESVIINFWKVKRDDIVSAAGGSGMASDGETVRLPE
jgi:hypothetical protein